MSKQEKESKAMTKDRLMGMQVIDSEGNDAGTVQDIAFTVGKAGVTLVLQTKKGETKEIAWEDIQAAGDFVILKPVTAQAQPSSAQPMAQTPQETQPQVCPKCGRPLTYIPQYQQWYCYNDKKYLKQLLSEKS
jgi:sporulation protein YlmC with PRC-barrel domain